MRFIASSDWHILSSTPRVRKDDYGMTQYFKIVFIINEAERLECDILVSGDMFDGPRCPWWLWNMYVRLFKTFKYNIYVIPGQHDMHFHNPDIENTPLGGLLASEVVKWPRTDTIYGVEFEGEMPEDYTDVIMAHMPITPSTPPFFMKDAISAKQAVNMFSGKCKVLVTGDYHDGFYKQSKGITVINPGPIMRSAKDKMDYIPKIYYYDDGKVTEIQIPIKDDVFDLSILESDDRREYSEELKELAGSFTDNTLHKEFKGVVAMVMDKMETPKDVRKVVKGIIQTGNTNEN